MKDNVKIGVINGGNNNFNLNTHVHQHNHSNPPARKEGKPDDSGGAVIGLIMGVIIATAVVAANYLLHHEVIYFWLKMTLVVAGAIHCWTLATRLINHRYEFEDWLYPGVGLLLVTLLWLLTSDARDALPEAALAIAQMPTKATGLIPQGMEIWKRFSPDGQQIILNNLGGAICLAIGILMNIAFGLHQVIEAIGSALEGRLLMLLANKLQPAVAFGAIGSFVMAGAAYWLSM